MQPRVLVAYATRTGSSEEVARTLAEVFRGSDFEVDVTAAKHVATVKPYGAVVISVALYMGKMHKDVRRFLAKNRDSLARTPIALFVLGPVHQDEKEWRDAEEQLEKELKNFPWLTPISRHIVGGRFDPARLGFPFNILPALRKMPMSDALDWNLIRDEAGRLAEQFLRVG